jgi:fructose 1,6-bisphosphatase
LVPFAVPLIVGGCIIRFRTSHDGKILPEHEENLRSYRIIGPIASLILLLFILLK